MSKSRAGPIAPLAEEFSLFDYEGELICGVDEAGRGPLAGPVMAAAVILDPVHPIAGLRDSKKLSEAKRDLLAIEIKKYALSWAVAECSEQEIDELNILQATMLAMRRAVEGLSVTPSLALIDGNRCPVMKVRSEAIVKGDDKVQAISAASILAKTRFAATSRGSWTRCKSSPLRCRPNKSSSWRMAQLCRRAPPPKPISRHRRSKWKSRWRVTICHARTPKV